MLTAHGFHAGYTDMKKILFNYDNLRTMDMVVCAGRSPFAMITRIITGGWKGIRNHDIAVHTGMIYDLDGQKLIAEMQPRGLELNSLERYNRIGKRRWVISIRRSEAYNNEGSRYTAQKRMALDLRRQLQYDYAGLFEFVSERIEDDKDRCYCSEYYYQLSKDCVGYPPSFGVKVLPYDLQVCGGFHTVENWRKTTG